MPPLFNSRGGVPNFFNVRALIHGVEDLLRSGFRPYPGGLAPRRCNCAAVASVSRSARVRHLKGMCKCRRGHEFGTVSQPGVNPKMSSVIHK